LKCLRERKADGAGLSLARRPANLSAYLNSNAKLTISGTLDLVLTGRLIEQGKRVLYTL